MLFAAIRWLQHEWPERKKSIAGLITYLRLELLQSWQLVELKKYPKELEHIFKVQDVQDMIDKALSSISLQCSEIGAGEGESSSNVFNRRLINDPLWNEFEFEMNPNIHENYLNFCSYLSQLDGCHWRKIKYADPKHESVMFWRLIKRSFAASSAEAFQETINLHSTNETTKAFSSLKAKILSCEIKFQLLCSRFGKWRRFTWDTLLMMRHRSWLVSLSLVKFKEGSRETTIKVKPLFLTRSFQRLCGHLSIVICFTSTWTREQLAEESALFHFESMKP